jgi:hypothetical protein
LAKAIMILAAAGAALGLATAAQAENWYNFYMVPQGTAFVDMDSIIRRPGHVSAKVQSTFPETQHLQKAGQILTYTKSLDLIDIDCKASVYRFLQRTLMNAAGEYQTTISDPDNPSLIQDHTPQAVLAKAFCPKGNG